MHNNILPLWPWYSLLPCISFSSLSTYKVFIGHLPTFYIIINHPCSHHSHRHLTLASQPISQTNFNNQSRFMMCDFIELYDDSWYDPNALYAMPIRGECFTMESYVKALCTLALGAWMIISAIMLLYIKLKDTYQASQSPRRDWESPSSYIFRAGGQPLERKPCPRRNYVTKDVQVDNRRAEKRRRVL